jgi:hypothetical protein
VSVSLEEKALPVTITRPSDPLSDLVTKLLVNQIRVWAIRRALRRFFPNQTFSYRDVMVGVGAVRWLVDNSDHTYWTSPPLAWQKKVEQLGQKLAEKVS